MVAKCSPDWMEGKSVLLWVVGVWDVWRSLTYSTFLSVSWHAAGPHAELLFRNNPQLRPLRRRRRTTHETTVGTDCEVTPLNPYLHMYYWCGVSVEDT